MSDLYTAHLTRLLAPTDHRRGIGLSIGPCPRLDAPTGFTCRGKYAPDERVIYLLDAPVTVSGYVVALHEIGHAVNNDRRHSWTSSNEIFVQECRAWQYALHAAIDWDTACHADMIDGLWSYVQVLHTAPSDAIIEWIDTLASLSLQRCGVAV